MGGVIGDYSGAGFGQWQECGFDGLGGNGGDEAFGDGYCHEPGADTGRGCGGEVRRAEEVARSCDYHGAPVGALVGVGWARWQYRGGPVAVNEVERHVGVEAGGDADISDLEVADEIGAWEGEVSALGVAE